MHVEAGSAGGSKNISKLRVDVPVRPVTKPPMCSDKPEMKGS